MKNLLLGLMSFASISAASAHPFLLTPLVEVAREQFEIQANSTESQSANVLIDLGLMTCTTYDLEGNGESAIGALGHIKPDLETPNNLLAFKTGLDKKSVAISGYTDDAGGPSYATLRNKVFSFQYADQKLSNYFLVYEAVPGIKRVVVLTGMINSSFPARLETETFRVPQDENYTVVSASICRSWTQERP